MNAPAALTAARTNAGTRTSVRALREGPGKPTARARTEPGSVQARGSGPDACTDAGLLPIAGPDRCPVPECTRSRRFGELMCGPHWGQVPKAIQRAVYRAWGDGEGFGTRAHLAARDAAIAAVCRSEAAQAPCPPKPSRQPEPARAPEPVTCPGAPESSPATDAELAGAPAETAAGPAQPGARTEHCGKYSDAMRCACGQRFERGKGDHATQRCVTCQSAERLAAAGIGPDDPGLQQWIGWNVMAFARARRKAGQQQSGGGDAHGRHPGPSSAVSR